MSSESEKMSCMMITDFLSLLGDKDPTSSIFTAMPVLPRVDGEEVDVSFADDTALTGVDGAAVADALAVLVILFGEGANFVRL